VTLINMNGLAIIGPGSEWFWTAVSGLVLAVTFVAIYRQLSLQRGAAAIKQLERFEQQYASERMLRSRLGVLRAQRDGVLAENLPRNPVTEILNYWERVGTLARRKYIDVDVLWEGGSGFWCHADWVRLAPAIARGRADEQNPEIGVYFEWLARSMESRAKVSGVALDTPERQAERLAQSIAQVEEALLFEEQLRAAPGRTKAQIR